MFYVLCSSERRSGSQGMIGLPLLFFFFVSLPCCSLIPFSPCLGRDYDELWRYVGLSLC